MDGLQIRSATESDVNLILDLIGQLADYEKLAHEAVAQPDELRRHLFTGTPAAEVLIAEITIESGAPEPVGFALFFGSFSTFLGKPGIYLEDLFIRPEHRGKGYGKALLSKLAALALERDCGRLEWSVLDWNEPAIGFYRNLGAVSMEGWTVNRLTGDALERLART